MSMSRSFSENGLATRGLVVETPAPGDSTKSSPLLIPDSVFQCVVWNSKIGQVLTKLAKALEFARDCNRSKWDFAVELADFERLEISHDELRWLIGKGFVQHAHELTGYHRNGRTFGSPAGYSFSNRSCFVITHAGLRFERQLNRTAHKQDEQVAHSPLIAKPDESSPQPYWDSQRHELRLGKLVVKRFKWRAINQEAILTAFQEDGWPARIDDPLSPTPNTDPKRRLSDAIKCLNRKQQNSVIRFSGDGTGEGVLWDVVVDV